MTAKTKNQTASQTRPKIVGQACAERPPVVVVMGHIDHGKSTLLDYIRQTNIVAREAGGITQAVSAYEVLHKKGKVEKKITFLDTPGHEAFTAIRERGAKIADIAILIVSAEDGVKPQTVEALKAIREAKTPFIVAINKIDKPNANIERVKQELAENDILIESYGGTIPSTNISSKTGDGVEELLDLLLLVTEMEELKGEANLPASGFVLEANMSSKTGITGTLIIKNGTLHQGDFIVVDGVATKIKILRDFQGQAAKALSFSAPAQVIGFAELPQVGASFQTFTDKKMAEKAAEIEKAARKKVTKTNVVLGADVIEVPLLIKADVVGSAEAIEREIKKLASDKLQIKILGLDIGPITENDLKLACGSKNTIVLGFNVSADRSAQDLGTKLNIPIQTFDIIYKMSEWLKEELTKRTPKVEVEEMIGKVKILKLFGESKGKQVIGGVVTSGLAQLGKQFKVLRRETEIGRGKITELQEQKVATKEVVQDHQFGAMVEAKVSIAAGDYLEIFEVVVK